MTSRARVKRRASRVRVQTKRGVVAKSRGCRDARAEAEIAETGSEWGSKRQQTSWLHILYRLHIRSQAGYSKREKK
eukprot:561079-Pleurochrysis_carterae.AAC.3